MKKIFHIFMPLLFLSTLTFAATRGDIKILEASEDIRYLSQKISKNYLYYFKHPKETEMKEILNSQLESLGNDLRVIATATKNGDAKDILEFLSYSKSEISDMLKEDPNEEFAALLLDHSETLLEGADSIASIHKYDFSSEERMIMLVKKIEYLMQRVLKYYMAIHTGFDNSTNREYFLQSRNQMELSLSELSKYDYPSDIKKTESDLIYYWNANRDFFNKSDTIFIPKLMFISIDYLDNLIAKLELYHTKNQ